MVRHTLISGLKRIGLSGCLIFCLQCSLAQNLNNLSFGTDSTLDVMTWNIEWFPKNGQQTIDSVKTIIQNLNIDVIALQEINDTALFRQMVNSLPGYETYFESSYYAGLAYIYNSNTVQINSFYEIYTTFPYWTYFPRSPMVMDFNFMNDNYILINNHFKCCGDGILDQNNPSDEEYRRQEASNLLQNYIDSNFSSNNVIVLGDLNDVLTDDLANNVFQNFIDNYTNYEFVDYNIATGPSANWSYPNWPSHLDHILITNELFDNMQLDESTVSTIRIDDHMGSFSIYDGYVSDHRPVGIKIGFDSGLELSKKQLPSTFHVYPNPFKDGITIECPILSESMLLEIRNIQGQLIDQIIISQDQSNISWTAGTIPEGIYVFQLKNFKQVIATKKVILIH